MYRYVLFSSINIYDIDSIKFIARVFATSRKSKGTDPIFLVKLKPWLKKLLK
jgi:hypothetical protein